METNNKLYQNQGIHVISNLFTIENGIVKVLLIKRKNNPFIGMWALPSGALYNNEDLEDGAYRELFEKTGIKDVSLKQFKAYGKIDRSPSMRMVGIAFLGVIDSKRVEIIRNSRNTDDALWVSYDKIPNLAFDHNEILNDALNELKKEIVKSNILKSLYPDGVTMPELQMAYEAILKRNFDRRNFRKKMLSLDLLVDSNKEAKFGGNKPAKLYKFKEIIEDKEIF